jgi:cytochrome c-type biogenesis protein CcmH/NrfG
MNANAAIVIAVAGVPWLFTCQATQSEMLAEQNVVYAPALTPMYTGDDMKNSQGHLEEALQRQPGNTRAWALLARTQLHPECCRRAVQAYSSALALQPNNADLRIKYAEAEFLGNDRQWSTVPISATNLNHPEARRLAGAQQFAEEDYPAAVRIWEKLLKAAPANFKHARDLATTFIETRALRDGNDPAAARLTAGVGARLLPVAAPISTGTPSPDDRTRHARSALRAPHIRYRAKV